MEEDEERQAGKEGGGGGSGGLWAYNQKHPFLIWIDPDT